MALLDDFRLFRGRFSASFLRNMSKIRVIFCCKGGNNSRDNLLKIYCHISFFHSSKKFFEAKKFFSCKEKIRNKAYLKEIRNMVLTSHCNHVAHFLQTAPTKKLVCKFMYHYELKKFFFVFQFCILFEMLASSYFFHNPFNYRAHKNDQQGYLLPNSVCMITAFIMCMIYARCLCRGYQKLIE